MSLVTSVSPINASQQSTVPQLRTFQSLVGDISEAMKNVNLFRGQLSFSIPIVSLKSRGGLSVNVKVSYQSNVRDAVSETNLTGPTGLLGLGWSMPFPLIEVDFESSVTPYDGRYYLTNSQGARNRLYQISTSANGVFEFECEDFSFEKIIYTQSTETWTITDIDGTVTTYGGQTPTEAGSPILYGIKWGGADGNWTGSSVTSEQSYFALAWNQSKITNRWGDEIRFEYTNFADDSVQIGNASGLYYIRACYVKKIVDPLGRLVTFNYGNKLYNSKIKEYDPPQVNPNAKGYLAYQSRYETRYLKSVTLDQTLGNSTSRVSTINFLYSVDKFADPSAPGNSELLYKRYLRGISILGADNNLRPGLRFDYYEGSSKIKENRGALKTLTYPDGAQAIYKYAYQSLPKTSRDLTLSSTDPNWVPGIPYVWFGSDYTILVKYSKVDSNQLSVEVLDWNGQWVRSQPLNTKLYGNLKADSLQVHIDDDRFVLTLQMQQGDSDGTLRGWGLSRTYGKFGNWTVQTLEMPYLSQANWPYQVAVGNKFVVVAAKGQSKIQRYTWNPFDKQWNDNAFTLSTGQQGEWALGAYGNVLMLTQYQPNNALVNHLYYLDRATLNWNDSLQIIDSIQTYYWDDDFSTLTWSVAGSFATATYVTSKNKSAKTLNYEVRLYTWDAKYGVTIATNPIRGTNIAYDTSNPVAISTSVGSLIGNLGSLRRYNGNTWIIGVLGTFESTTQPHFAYSPQAAIGVGGTRSSVAIYSPYIEQGQFQVQVVSAGSQGPEVPTVNSFLITVRDQIYRIENTGNLTPLTQTIPTSATVVGNQAPNYLVYGQQNGESYIYQMWNREFTGSAEKIPGIAFPDDTSRPGTNLVGFKAFVYYQGSSFDEPSELTFCRILERKYSGPISDFVISSVSVTDGMGNTRVASFDYTLSDTISTTGPYGLASQFNQVKTVLGSSDPKQTPEGYSIIKFLDGLTPQEGTTELYSTLNGYIHEVEAYNNIGTQVAKTTKTWSVYTQSIDPTNDNTLALAGSWSRLTSASQYTYDVDPLISNSPQLPLETVHSKTYSLVNGQPSTQTSINYNTATKKQETLEEIFVFAYEKYADMISKHILKPLAMRIKTVDKSVIQMTAMLWKTCGTDSVWAPLQKLLARSATATLTDAQWAGSTQPTVANWMTLWSIVERDSHGGVTEYKDPTGLPHSVILDINGQFAIASFKGASKTNQQSAYVGFESYEDLSNWELNGSNATMLAAIESGDAIIGQSALKMSGSANSPLTHVLSITETVGRQYVLSCWVKTESGFGNDPGTATWIITGVKGGKVSLSIPDTNNEWKYLAVLLDVVASTSAQAVLLSLINSKSKHLLVDCIRFSPANTPFQSMALDPTFLKPEGVTHANGATSRHLYNTNGKSTGLVGINEGPSQLKARFQSRMSNGGQFSASSPNAALQIKPVSWAYYQSLEQGDAWKSTWQPVPGVTTTVNTISTAWKKTDGWLSHTDGTSDSLVFSNFPTSGPGSTQSTVDYGMNIRVKADGVQTGKCGLVFADNYVLAWSPTTCCWTLSDSLAKTVSVTGTIRSLIDISLSSYATDLNAGTLPSELPNVFAHAGLPLDPSATVVCAAANRQWSITNSSATFTYYLVVSPTDPSQISVTLFNNQWTLLVRGKQIAFFVDGGQVLSYKNETDFSKSMAIYATNALSVKNLSAFADGAVQISCLNAEGKVIQEQVLTDDGLVGRQTFYDNLGRCIIKTQCALLSPTSGKWGKYQTNLATLNKSTYYVSGLVKDQNTHSGNYPYSRKVFEASPLGRVKQRGLPGTAYAITTSPTNSHITTYSYGLNDGSLGFTAGKLVRRTITSPDGGRIIKLTDQRKQHIASALLIQKASSSDELDSYAVERKVYDAAGNCTQRNSPKGWGNLSIYNFLCQKTADTTPNQGTIKYLYDAAGRLRFQMDGKGASESPNYIRFWKYDEMSRIVAEGCAVHDWDTKLATSVDDQNYPKTATPSNTFTYDFLPIVNTVTPLINVTKVTQSITGNQVQHLQPKPNSELSFKRSDFFVTEVMEYDLRGKTRRFTSTSTQLNPSSTTTTYEYDNGGNPIKIGYPGSSAPTVAYALDPIGRVTGIAVDDVKRVNFTYDSNGHVKTEAWMNSSGNKQIGSGITYSYEAPGWLNQVENDLFRLQLGYSTSFITNGQGVYDGSPSSARVKIGDASETLIGYSYNDARYLSAVTYPNETVSNETYSYDANGNIRTIGAQNNTYTSAGHDQVQGQTGHTTLSYDYDGNGAQDRWSSKTDGALTLEATYDVFRRQPLSLSVGSNESEKTLSLRYGYRARRIYKEVKTATEMASTTYFRGAADDPLSEVDASNNLTAYVYGPTGLSLVIKGGESYAVVKDQIKSIRAVADENNTLVGGFDYTPYGASHGSELGSDPQLLTYRFTSRELDESGLYDFRARLYSPSQGRFTSPDPAHQYMSPYAYVDNDPLKIVDEDGRIGFFAAISAGIAAAAATIAEGAAAAGAVVAGAAAAAGTAVVDAATAVGAAVVDAAGALTSAAASAAAGTLTVGEATELGGALGFAQGVIQGSTTISQEHLSGAKAAGVFFGDLALDIGFGAIDAVGGQAVSESFEGFKAFAIGLTLETGLGTAQSAIDAPLHGENAGEAAWVGALTSAVSFSGAVGAGELSGKALKNVLNEGKKVVTQAAIGGAVGATLGDVTAKLATGSDPHEELINTLHGAAFGVFGGVAPELVTARRARLARYANSFSGPLYDSPVWNSITEGML